MGNYITSGSFSWLKKLVPFLKAKELRILMNGLDAAGKTTILYRVKLGEVVTTIPTIGFNVETIQWKNLMLTCWDVGGRDKIRPLYRHYYQNTDVIIFVIDSNDRERIDEAKEELRKMMMEDELRDSLLLVIANKQDLANHLTVDEIKEKIEFDKLRHIKHKTIIGACATTGDGLDECLNWISTIYEMKQLSSPIEETIDDVKILVSIKSNNSLTNYFSSYFNDLTNFAYRAFGSKNTIN